MLLNTFFYRRGVWKRPNGPPRCSFPTAGVQGASTGLWRAPPGTFLGSGDRLGGFFLAVGFRGHTFVFSCLLPTYALSKEGLWPCVEKGGVKPLKEGRELLRADAPQSCISVYRHVSKSLSWWSLEVYSHGSFPVLPGKKSHTCEDTIVGKSIKNLVSYGSQQCPEDMILDTRGECLLVNTQRGWGVSYAPRAVSA